MLLMTYAEENGERPFVLTRVIKDPASREMHMDIVGAFSRDEVTELGALLRQQVREHPRKGAKV